MSGRGGRLLVEVSAVRTPPFVDWAETDMVVSEMVADEGKRALTLFYS